MQISMGGVICQVGCEEWRINNDLIDWRWKAGLSMTIPLTSFTVEFAVVEPIRSCYRV